MPATPSNMPKDKGGVSIPVLGFQPTSRQTIAIGASAVRSAAFSTNTKVISVWATGVFAIELGDNTVAATTSSALIPANTWVDISLWTTDADQNRYASIIGDAGSTGNVYICERA